MLRWHVITCIKFDYIWLHELYDITYSYLLYTPGTPLLLITRFICNYMSWHVNTCITWYYMKFYALHQITCVTSWHTITCNYMSIHALHSLTLDYMCYIFLHDFTCSLSDNIHYIPFTECVKHQLSRQVFTGYQYLKYEPQKCPRTPGASGFGGVNSETWFEGSSVAGQQTGCCCWRAWHQVCWGRAGLGQWFLLWRQEPALALRILCV